MLALWILEVSLLVLVFLVLAVIFLFRQRNIVALEDGLNPLAPVSGRIKSIVEKDGFTDIEVLIPWWGEMGIYLPFRAELRNKTRRYGEAFFRYDFFRGSIERRGVVLVLEEIDTNRTWEIAFGECTLGGRAEIMVAPGDRGAQGASIGYFPFGGVVRIRIPSSDGRLVLRRGESLVAGKTPVVLA